MSPTVFPRDESSMRTQETILNVLFVVAVVLFGILMLCMLAYSCTRSRRYDHTDQNEHRILVLLITGNDKTTSGSYSIVDYLTTETKDTMSLTPGSNVTNESVGIERVADSNGNICVVDLSLRQIEDQKTPTTIYLSA